MKKAFLILVAGVLAAASLSLPACVKKGNDVPEDQTSYDPNIPVTHTIAELLAMPQGSPITEDVVVAGVVSMDDRSGNYYKKFVIQDNTGGIEINLDQNNIYNDYPVGRKVYLKAKGLTISNYGGLPQIGYGVDERNSIVAIPFIQADDFIIKASYPHPVEIDTFDYLEVSNPDNVRHLLNKVIAIRNVEFAPGSYGVPYAQATATTNRTLAGCGGGSNIVVRTSNYARFQAAKTPTGSGVIVGLYTRFNATPQLIIRDTTDVHFNPQRCDGSTPVEPEPISIADLRSRYNDTPVTLENLKIYGTVISDRSGGNIQSRNVIVQQGDRGITVRFNGDHAFNLGDSIEVNLNGATLEEFNGLLQANNANVSSATKVGTGTITPRVLTIADLLANFEQFESTLVSIENVNIPSGMVFSGNILITDPTGSIVMYTSAGATFATNVIPAGLSRITGVIGQFNETKQIQIRKLSDLQ